MPIDFSDEQNKFTYTGRTAHDSWTQTIMSVVSPKGLSVADIGCGGGIYSRAWRAMGATEVIGVDSSPTMVSTASQTCADVCGVSFRVGDATNTGLPDNSVDVVFERALIHHIQDIHACFREALRVLKPGGMALIQDRTHHDVALPGSSEHIRGYFFECFPKLSQVESSRRRTDEAVQNELCVAGFEDTSSMSVWETRKVYASKGELWEDLRQRTGRSILYELDDVEVGDLISFINSRMMGTEKIVEKDRWTLWKAQKPQTA